jgi:periplasmic protein TonB
MTQLSTIKSTPPKVSSPISLPLVAGFAMGLLIFMLLPVAQWLDALTSKHDTSVDLIELAPPPPPMAVIEQHHEEKVKQEDIKDLKEAPPPPSLDMLELSLSTDLSGIGTGDVMMPTFNVGQDIEDMIFDIKELDEKPRPTVQAAPQYPLDLRQAGINGEVVVQFIVDSKGNVRNIRIVRSTNTGFNEAVLRAVRNWKFEPGKKNGRKVNTRVQQPIPFKTN